MASKQTTTTTSAANQADQVVRGSVALVLGSGGVLGASFHAGVLLALHEEWGIDARYVDELLGTSAGALTAAFTAAGIGPDDLMRREQGLALSASGKRVMAARPTTSERRSRPSVAFGFPAAPHLILPALRWPGSVQPGTVMAGLLPRGQHGPESIAETVDAVLAGAWPETARLRTVAVNLGTGQRQIFSNTSGVTPGEAVAASCAIPGIHAPVSLGRAEYIDGATHSANNLDAVGLHDVVIVSSPSTSDPKARQALPWALPRQSATRQLRREADAVGEHCVSVIVEPDQAVLEAMGSDPMSTANRAEVAVASHARAKKLFADLARPTSVATA